MPVITIATPFNIDLEFKLATLPRRAQAWAVDMVIICAYYYLMLRIVYPLFDMSENVSTAAELFFLVIPVMIYQLAFEIFMNGQTIGKRLVGIKIIDREGQEPTWGQYIIRWMLCIGNLFIYILPKYLLETPAILFVFLLIYLPDVIVLLISRKWQRIGDLAAGTVVIDARYKADITQTIYQEIEVKDYVPVFPQVMRLSDRDINGIRNLISDTRPGKDAEAYMYQVVDKIKSVLKIETEIDGFDFLQQLLHDYNYITSRNSGGDRVKG